MAATDPLLSQPIGSALRAMRMATAAQYRARAEHLAAIGDIAGAVYNHGRAVEIELIASAAPASQAPA